MTPIYLDFETSGFSHQDSVLQVGAVATEGDSVLDSFNMTCNPGEGVLMRPGLDDALAVNGLTREELRAAPPILEVSSFFREWLAVFGKSSLHAYNNAFEQRFGCVPPWRLNKLSFGHCVMQRVASGHKACKLSVAAARFNLDWDPIQAHGALYDAKMAHRVDRAYQKRNGMVRV